MAGQYEDPETRQETGASNGGVGPAASPGGDAGVAAGAYAEPGTRPAHPTPSYVAPESIRAGTDGADSSGEWADGTDAETAFDGPSGLAGDAGQDESTWSAAVSAAPDPAVEPQSGRSETSNHGADSYGGAGYGGPGYAGAGYENVGRGQHPNAPESAAPYPYAAVNQAYQPPQSGPQPMAHFSSEQQSQHAAGPHPAAPYASGPYYEHAPSGAQYAAPQQVGANWMTPGWGATNQAWPGQPQPHNPAHPGAAQPASGQQLPGQQSPPVGTPVPDSQHGFAPQQGFGASQQMPPQPPGAPQPGNPVQPGNPQAGSPQPGGVHQGGPHQGGPAHQVSAYSQSSPPATGANQSIGQDLSSAQLLRQAKRTPQSGWRKALYLGSGKTINLGESPADKRRRELINRINQPLHGCYRIAMLSLKGGVGKTTTTATLGSTFASLRGDRVVAVDANPDRGTLSQKIPTETTATVRHLLRDAQRIRKYSDVRAYTSQGPSRLEILASEQDPAVSEAFSEDDYERTATLLEHFYNVVLTDCGTGLMHSAMKGVLDQADSLVIVSSSSIDGARSASATVDWLDAHGYGDLVSRSVAVVNAVRPAAGKVDIDKLAAHFEARCRAVAKIPFDPHLEEGAEVDLDRLSNSTRMAMLELAAVVADDFPYAMGRQRQV